MLWPDLLGSSSDEIILTLSSKDMGIIRKGCDGCR